MYIQVMCVRNKVFEKIKLNELLLVYLGKY